jgi:hypothetical protein
MGITHVKCQNCLVYLSLHVLRFIESVFLTWSLQEEGAQETSLVSNNECVRAIVVGCTVCNRLWWLVLHNTHSITLFKAITMLCRIDSIMRNILHIQTSHFVWMWRTFHKIMSARHNTVMALNNVMEWGEPATSYRSISLCSQITGSQSTSGR